MTRLQEFLKALSDKDAKTYYVGGYVRDKILGKENKDIDIEIHYITEEKFLDTCKSFDLDIKLCGQAFGVYKAVLDGQDIDFSFPRTEKLIGTSVTYKGKTDFGIDDTKTTPYGEGLTLFAGNTLNVSFETNDSRWGWILCNQYS